VALTWDGTGRPLVIAHRGDASAAPENTVAAVEAARAAGADGVEIDVRLSRDGVPVVVHDLDLARMAGSPERVGDLPARELLRRAVRTDRAGAAVREAPVPTLEAVVAACGADLLLNLELKAEADTPLREVVRLAGAAAEVMRRSGLEDRALVSSFHPLALVAMRRAWPESRCALIFDRRQALPLRSGAAALLLYPRIAVNPERRLVSHRFLARWRAVGARIHPWTVDDPREMSFFAAVGADAIITNEPRLLVQVLAWGAAGWRIAEGQAECAGPAPVPGAGEAEP